MPAHMEENDEFLHIIKPYMKKGESYIVSSFIELNGKKYREVGFFKRGFKALGRDICGYLYINNDWTLVTSKNIQRELAKLGLFNDIFFSSERNLSILAGLKTEKDLKRDLSEVEEVLKGLDFLYGQHIESALKVKNVTRKLTELRQKTNNEINRLSSLVNEVEENGQAFSQELLENLYPFYEQILKLNFEKVKLIDSLEDCLDEIKTQAKKIRKKLKYRMNQNVVRPLLRVEDEVSYYIRIIRTYAKVLNMTTFQYLKFLSDMNKEKAEARVNLIRI